MSLMNALGICTGNLIVLIAIAGCQLPVRLVAVFRPAAAFLACHMPHAAQAAYAEGVHLHFKQLLATKNLINKLDPPLPRPSRLLKNSSSNANGNGNEVHTYLGSMTIRLGQERDRERGRERESDRGRQSFQS